MVLRLTLATLILSVIMVGISCDKKVCISSENNDTPLVLRLASSIREIKPRYVDLSELISNEDRAKLAASRIGSTAMIPQRDAPAHGYRTMVDGVQITSNCGHGFCIDGLLDLKTGKKFIESKLTPEQVSVISKDGSEEQLIHIKSVSDKYVSVYLGKSSFSGGAHTNNDLDCMTFDRTKNTRIGATTLLGSATTHKLLADLNVLLKSEESGNRQWRNYELSDRSLLISQNGSVILCALAPFVYAGTIYELDLGYSPKGPK